MGPAETYQLDESNRNDAYVYDADENARARAVALAALWALLAGLAFVCGFLICRRQDRPSLCAAQAEASISASIIYNQHQSSSGSYI